MTERVDFHPSDIELGPILQRAMDFAQIGICRYLFDGTVLFMDQGAFRIFELDEKYPEPSAVIGKNLSDMVQQNGCMATIGKDIRAAGRVQKAEFQCRTSSGVTKWVSFDAHLVCDSNTGEESILVMLQNINERKQTEEALRESEERYRVLVENQGEGLGIVDQEEYFLFANPAAGEIFGVPPDELVGRKLDQFLDEENFSIVRRQTKIRSKGEKGTYDIEITRSDGRKRQIMITATPEYDDEGRFIGAVGIFRDITERKQAEQALKESEERFRMMFEYAPDAYYMNTLDGTFIDGNQAAEKLTGFNREELIGKSFLELKLLPMKHLTKAAELLMENMNGASTGPDEFVLNRKNGEQVHVEISTHPITFKNSAVVLGIARDVTDRKRADEEKGRLEGQLHQSNKMEAIGRLAGGVAHDFNNLLTGIIGHLEMLLLSLKEDDPIREDLDEIDKASKRAAALTQQLLAFSRKQVIAPKVTDLNELLADTKQMLIRIIEENVELAFLPGKNLGRVKVDAHQIEQVLVNLAVNARDAMPEGGRLSIETENVSLDEKYCRFHEEVTPGEYVMLAVSDTGTGIDQETQKRIFEPFFTTKEMGKGTGLGLATVYGIVKQNKGSISLYSEVGVGTTFKIYLPRVQDEAMPAAKPKMRELPKGSETLLLVEDEEMVRSLAEKILLKQGYRMLTAIDTGDALRICQEHDGMIDLLLTDVVMPKMNGKELFNQLKTIRPSINVLYMSGYTENVIAQHGVLDEGTQFIAKPFTVGSLIEKVREILDSPNGR